MTDDQYQQLIITMVGDDAAGTLATSVPLLWADRESISDPRLKSLYVRRDAIDLMLGRVRGQVRITGVGGASIDAAQLTANLQAMRTNTERLIGESQSAGGLSFVTIDYGISSATDEFGRPECF